MNFCFSEKTRELIAWELAFLCLLSHCSWTNFDVIHGEYLLCVFQRNNLRVIKQILSEIGAMSTTVAIIQTNNSIGTGSFSSCRVYSETDSLAGWPWCWCRWCNTDAWAPQLERRFLWTADCTFNAHRHTPESVDNNNYKLAGVSVVTWDMTSHKMMLIAVMSMIHSIEFKFDFGNHLNLRIETTQSFGA